MAKKARTCFVKDCDKKHSAKGLCIKHYTRMLRTGTTDKLLRSGTETRPLKERFDEKIEIVTESGCWIWTAGADDLGYGRIGVKGSTKLAHRVGWELYKGKIPDGKNLCHRCDVPACVNPDHLFIGTQADNMMDMGAKGRGNHVHGERNGKTKITEKTAREILLLKGKMRHKDISEKYNISINTVRGILRRVRWVYL